MNVVLISGYLFLVSHCDSLKFNLNGFQTLLAASVDSGPHESWTGRGRKKGGITLTQDSSHQSKPRARILRGHRQEALEVGESSPPESDSSDQGEPVNTESCTGQLMKAVTATTAMFFGSVGQ